ncbi:MAG: ABC transporter permease [Spirochaetaceae bacterium]|nr:MAG: ABC transporter permease [Spirochaetaceae bacterium]
MIILKLALRTLLRRKRRMVSIGILVLTGTVILVFGETVASSAVVASKQAIIDNFTGDLIVYSEVSREKPSPFAFTTPLPVIGEIRKVQDWLDNNTDVALSVPIAQNYALISVERGGRKIELPFIFYAVDPEKYRAAFDIIGVRDGSYFGIGTIEENPGRGILISLAQNERFKKSYDITLSSAERVTFLGLTPGGSVNAIPTTIRGIFEPGAFKSVFDYINFVDIITYSELYNFTGVKSGSLPEAYEKALSSESEDDIFALADDPEISPIQVETLVSEALSGYTMIAVKLNNHDGLEAFRAEIEAAGLGVKTLPWDQASGFYAPIAQSLSAVIYVIVGIIFLIVALIFMNTMIINVVERTHEIGTMRALGSEKSFIRALFVCETLLLNLFFAIAGIIISAMLMAVAGPSGLPLPDIISQFLIGGGNLPVYFSLQPFVLALVIVCVVSVLATLYPVRVATKISPLAALADK